MKSGIEMAQDIYSLLDVSSVNDIITGSNYLFERPQNSSLQDIVTSTLALTNEQMQKGVVNVNIHCPNLSGLVINGKTDNTQPDIASLKLISKAVLTILNCYYGIDFRCFAQTTGIPVRDNSNGSWFANIRVDYYSFQNNYTNI